MSQHDMNIANQGFPAFRSDLNDALVALVSSNSGASAPATTFANMPWYDTTNNIFKIRNEDNDAWISVFTLDQSTDAITAIGSVTLADVVSLTGTQTLTNKTLTNPAINGQTVDKITDTDGGVLRPISSVMRNRIINGDMRIDQRNAGASVTQSTSNQYPVDRFLIVGSVASKFTAQKNAGSVTPPAGFVSYLGCTSSSAYTVGASESFTMRQYIEGLNIADLGWGTVNAKTVTLSFWVYSSITGTFGGSLRNSGGTRNYPYSYEIYSSNTWEQKSITIAGDTTGAWLTTIGQGIQVVFSLGAGSTVSGAAGSWSATTYASATGATSVVGTSGATFYITGVQLEVGSSATGFEYRQYQQELALCHRYYYQVNNPSFTTGFYRTSTVVENGRYFLPVPMRTNPTVTSTSGTSATVYVNNSATSVSAIAFAARVDAITADATTPAQTVNWPAYLALSSGNNVFVNAEL